MAVTATAADVVAYLGSDELTADDVADAFTTAVDVIGDDYDMTATLTAAQQTRVDLAAVMYAARLYRRRFSVNGIETVGDWGPVRVSISDPDIHRMLSRWELHRFG